MHLEVHHVRVISLIRQMDLLRMPLAFNLAGICSLSRAMIDPAIVLSILVVITTFLQDRIGRKSCLSMQASRLFTSSVLTLGIATSIPSD